MSRDKCCESHTAGPGAAPEGSSGVTGRDKNGEEDGGLGGGEEDAGSSPGREDPLEEEMATHSSTLAWRIPGTEEHSGLQFHGAAKSWTCMSD